jgi:hypothetical protein
MSDSKDTPGGEFLLTKSSMYLMTVLNTVIKGVGELIPSFKEGEIKERAKRVEKIAGEAREALKKEIL